MKKTKYIILFSFILTGLFLSSCEKDRDQHEITYFVTKSVSGFDATYLLGEDNFIEENVVVNSEAEIWTVSHFAKPGDIVYVSVLDTTASSFVNVRVMIDGKFYKEKTRDDVTTKPVTVSGTVPY
jgi:methylthioribose-1-phosphate isomerase